MNKLRSDDRKIVMLGAGGHAKVLLALLAATSRQAAGVCDPALSMQGIDSWCGIPVLGGDSFLDAEDPQKVWLVNGVGQLVKGGLRARLYRNFAQRGFVFPPLIHPTAWVAPDVQLADGVQVMAGAIVQPGSSVGANTILNTRSSVDHDCVIGADVHVAPGAVICGKVRIGDGSFVGAGATVIQGVQTGKTTIVAAGATLRKDLRDDEILLPLLSEQRTRNTKDGKES